MCCFFSGLACVKDDSLDSDCAESSKRNKEFRQERGSAVGVLSSRQEGVRQEQG